MATLLCVLRASAVLSFCAAILEQSKPETCGCFHQVNLLTLISSNNSLHVPKRSKEGKLIGYGVSGCQGRSNLYIAIAKGVASG